jgi:hypothetical protein
MVLMVRPPGAENDTPADEVPLFAARGYDATSVDDAASESVLRDWVQRNGHADPAQTFRDRPDGRRT